jgi:hypothetical protein
MNQIFTWKNFAGTGLSSACALTIRWQASLPYMNVGQEARDFTINPFSLSYEKENLQFLFSFFRVLIEGNGSSTLAVWGPMDGPDRMLEL